MNRVRVTTFTLLLLAVMALAACGPAGVSQGSQPAAPAGQAATAVPSATLGAPLAPQSTSLVPPPPSTGPTSEAAGTASPQSVATAGPAAAAIQGGAAGVGDLQAALQQIYTSASPSVVNIQVTEGQPISGTRRPRIPAVPGLPGGTATPEAQGTPEAEGTPSLPNPHLPGGPVPLPTQAVGSGFVWDTQGRIVTNYHVVDGATQVSVTFSDGATVPATVVGADPDSDLAVIKVDPKGLTLQPIPLGDSTQVRPGQFVVAIGNPFALEGTMTFGIVSAMGRSLPARAQGQLPGQATYTIPDVIQTDAPINPGNSGGVLLDLQGRLIGVPTAIESASQSNSGVGFAIPSLIVRNTVPELIQNGKAQHPYLGISGTTLSPDLAQAMNLPATQRGALVVDVPQGGPAAAGGLRGSTRQATINGQQVPVGGDVIVKIDNQPVTRFDDLPSYLARSTKVGQTVVLTVLRDGQQTTLNVTLGNRPSLTGQAAATPSAGAQGTPEATTPAETEAPTAQATPQAGSTTSAPQLGGAATPEATTAATSAAPAASATPAAPATQATPQAGAGNVWLGVTVIDLTNEMAQAMNLPGDQQGVLIESVAPNSPAERAGLRGSTRAFTTSQGQQITVGGDVIVGVNGTDVTSGQDLTQIIRSSQPGQKVTLTLLRNGTQLDVSATLETRPGP